MNLRKFDVKGVFFPPYPSEQFSTRGVYSGHNNIVNNIGEFGSNLCLLDQLDFNDTTETYTYPTDRLTTAQVFMDYLDINENELITTNALYNINCLNILKNTIQPVSEPTNNITPSTQMTQ